MRMPGRSIFPVFLVVLLGALVALSPPLLASEDDNVFAAREDTYPEGIESITHSPVVVHHGERFEVTLRMLPGAEVPDRVSLIWCRVEPDYVCALPVIMQPSGTDEGVFSATIPEHAGGQFDVVQDGTRHVGYNVSLQYQQEEGTKRVFAPTHNLWMPETFPADVDGRYYFLELQGTARSTPAPGLVALFAALSLVFIATGFTTHRFHAVHEPRMIGHTEDRAGGGRDR